MFILFSERKKERRQGKENGLNCDLFVVVKFTEMGILKFELFLLGMKQLIGKLNDLWPEHSVALSIPKEIDKANEKIPGVEEVEGKSCIYLKQKNKIK